MATPQLNVDKQSTETADSPFDDTKADFVLISSDNVAFYVYSSFLSVVSPVFEVMFKLPQGVEQELYEGKPFVKVTDKAENLELLLTWCDPRCLTQPLEEPQAILEIADKYGMEDIMNKVDASLLEAKHLIAKDPLQIFAIAVRFQFKKLAKAAAAEAIKIPLQDWKRCKEMKHITVYTYDSLLQYRARCCKVARQAFADMDWILSDDPEDSSRFQVTTPCKSLGRAKATESDSCGMKFKAGTDLQAWFVDYIQLVEDTLQQRVAGAVAKEFDLMSKTLGSLATSTQCAVCRAMAPLLLEIAPFIAGEIDARIAKVKIKLDFE